MIRRGYVGSVAPMMYTTVLIRIPFVAAALALTAFEPFETVIDYGRRQLVLIPIDAAGQRRATAAYHVTTAIPLVPILIPIPAPGAISMWGVVGRLGPVIDTLGLDTGAPSNEVTGATVQQLGGHLTPTSPDPLTNMPRQRLDRFTLGGRTFTGIVVQPALPWAPGGASDLFGYPFFQQQTIVGFNLRTRQFLLYR